MGSFIHPENMFTSF